MLLYEIFYPIMRFENKMGYRRKLKYDDQYYQKAGGNKIKIKIAKVLDNKEIIFDEIYKDDKKKLILSTIKNDGKKYDCVVINLFEKDKYAILDSLQISDEKCIDLEDFGLKTSGRFHLKVAIKMLKKYQTKFNINKIILEDIATVKCNEEEFPLSSFMLLTKGYTFYGKEGFKYKENKLNKLLKRYQKYIDKLKVKDVKIKNFLKKSKNKELNEQIINMFQDNPEIKFIELLGIIFSRDNMLNEEVCCLYLLIRNKLILFYQNKLGEDYFDLFMTNLKMEMIL